MTATRQTTATPHGAGPSPAWFKARRRVVGVVFLLVLALLTWLSVELYAKRFTPVAMVTLYTDSAGNEMHVGSRVMVRGVQVGEVRSISTAGRGARLELAIQPGELPHIPANVSAQMVPTTLFGDRYVALILPARPATATLANGSVIGQDRSANAIEVEHVLNNLLPLLTSSEPDKLSVTLTAIARGLQGRGKKLGQTLATLDATLRRFNPNLPALDTDIKRLVQLTRRYHEALPQVIAALNDFSISSQTLADQRANYHALLTTLTTASEDLRAFLDANAGNIIHLGPASRSTLRILATYSPEFPCTLRALAKFVPNVNKILGQGTRQPGLHVQVVVVPSLGKYLPGKDTPIYGDNLGPHCYPVPFPGIKLNDGASPPSPTGNTAGPGSQPATTRSAPGPGGLAGSPAESELARELAGLSLRQRPASLPGWSGLLVAPLFRGADVTLGVNGA